MQTVTSRDGTTIAYDQIGSGDPVILVDGALCSRQLGPFPQTAKELAQHFTVVHYDRRGRGDSSEASADFEIEREVEDLEALIGRVGGEAALVGMSSGGALAIEAANRLSGVRQVIAYEVPYITDPAATFPPDFASRMRELVAEDRRSEAVRFFLRTVGMPAPLIQLMRATPPFRKLKRVAHTLPYDAELVTAPLGAERKLPRDRWSSVEARVVVVTGAKSPESMRGGGVWRAHRSHGLVTGAKSPESMREANAALADALGAEYRTLEGRTT